MGSSSCLVAVDKPKHLPRPEAIGYPQTALLNIPQAHHTRREGLGDGTPWLS